MEYESFEIRIRAVDDEKSTATVEDGPFRGAKAPFDLPYPEEEVETRIQALEDGLLEKDYQNGRSPKADEMGLQLFQSLIRDDVARDYDKTRALMSGRPDDALRIRLDFEDDPSLRPAAALPWELLRDPDGDYLARRRTLSLARLLTPPVPPRCVRVAGPLQILAVKSSPFVLPPLDLDKEDEEIRKALQGDEAGFQVTVLDNPTIAGLRETLLENRWHILHFMGHGNFEEEQGEACVCFEDRTTGRRALLTASMFQEQLKDITNLGLVVLNACQAGALPRRRGQNLFGSMAPELFRTGLPAVIAMQFSIDDDAAILLASRFYGRLAKGDPIEAALAETRFSIVQSDMADNWATPVLYLARRDAQVFEIVPGEEPMQPTPREPRRLAIRSFAVPPGQVYTSQEAEEMLDLSSFFTGPKGRQIRSPALWHTEIVPRLRSFLLEAASDRRPLLIDFSAHASIAFTAGYLLESKSGLDITILQRGSIDPKWKIESGVSPDDRLWLQEPDLPREAGVNDVAVAAGISDEVRDDVQDYLARAEIKVSRIVPATLSPAPSKTGVRDATHALQLAQSLRQKMRARTIQERHGVLHLFAAAPNGVLFFLGQQSRGLGAIQLYEHDFESKIPADYSPSILISGDI